MDDDMLPDEIVKEWRRAWWRDRLISLVVVLVVLMGVAAVVMVGDAPAAVAEMEKLMAEMPPPQN